MFYVAAVAPAFAAVEVGPECAVAQFEALVLEGYRGVEILDEQMNVVSPDHLRLLQQSRVPIKQDAETPLRLAC
jgi:hypothetical protein